MRRCREEGTDPPDRARAERRWAELGWPGELDSRLHDLLRFEAARRVLGDAAVDGACGPIVEWPATWGRWALAEHRTLVERHFRSMGAISRDEERQLS